MSLQLVRWQKAHLWRQRPACRSKAGQAGRQGSEVSVGGGGGGDAALLAALQVQRVLSEAHC